MNLTPKALFDRSVAELRLAWRVLLNRGPGQIQFWFIAWAVGIMAGLAALVFRVAVSESKMFLYGVENILFVHLPWYAMIAIPTLGGLFVGYILTRFTPDSRARAVADVIEGAALRDGRMERRAGIASALASFVTLSTGGSTGREGPVVHLAGVIATKVADFFRVDGITGRDLLGCAVASAVAASFNAPLAGALFALEVILRHFAVHAFAPIVIASVSGAVIGRLAFGNVAEFSLVAMTARDFYLELPAFLLLGLVCGLVSVLFMRSIFVADDIATAVTTRFKIPPMLRPALAGMVLGVIAIWFPHIIGVGYDMTSKALSGDLALGTVVVFAIVKAAAVAITMAGRMGGGIFSPSLMMGALTGLGFGIVATSIMPSLSVGATLYALAGMGAVAAAVLGAPISTVLIVFELTGDWQAGLAVMVAVSISTALASRIVNRSFFLTQLERRGVHIAAGPQEYLLSVVPVASSMVAKSDPNMPDEAACWDLVEQGNYVDRSATLEVAMGVFDAANTRFIPVLSLGGEDKPPDLLGVVFQVDALRAFNRALAAKSAEEHS